MSNRDDNFQPICQIGDYLWHPERNIFMKTSYVSNRPYVDGDTFVEGKTLEGGHLVHYELRVRGAGWMIPTQEQLEAGSTELRALEIALLEKQMEDLQRVMENARQRLRLNEIEYQALGAKYQELKRA